MRELRGEHGHRSTRFDAGEPIEQALALAPPDLRPSTETVGNPRASQRTRIERSARGSNNPSTIAADPLRHETSTAMTAGTMSIHVYHAGYTARDGAPRSAPPFTSSSRPGGMPLITPAVAGLGRRRKPGRARHNLDRGSATAPSIHAFDATGNTPGIGRDATGSRRLGLTGMRPLLYLLFATGCGLVAHVPPEAKGDTALQIENWYSQKICWFSMVPRGAAAAGGNWLGYIGIDPGRVQTLHVKPGDYRMHYEACDRAFQADHPLRIAGPTFLSIGRPMQTTPAGYTVITVTARGAQPYQQVEFDEPASGTPSQGGDCKAVGAPAENDRECCSGDTTWPAGMSAA
ncbi:MAG TPA: hypothetical protein VGC42_08560, partial [Kofleriaceae bacterium]